MSLREVFTEGITGEYPVIIVDASLGNEVFLILPIPGDHELLGLRNWNFPTYRPGRLGPLRISQHLQLDHAVMNFTDSTASTISCLYYCFMLRWTS